MSLAKLKKAELITLAESHDLNVDPDWNKDEIIEELEAAGIEAENVDNEVSTATKHSHSDGKHLSKVDRQRRLFSRTDHKPGEAMLMRSKKERQKDLLARTDRTK